MTKKRFICRNESIINLQTDELVNASSEESAEIVVYWLNELVKENNELKKENYGNLDGLNYYLEQNGHLSSKISDLECENEQLRKENNVLKFELKLIIQQDKFAKKEGFK